MADEDRSEPLGSEHLEKGMRLAFGLAGVKEGESVLDAIERITGTESRVHLPEADDEDSPVVRVPGEGSEDGAEDDPRYQIIGEIARGGVGVVFKGRDRDLGRDVAIKVLRNDLKSSPEVIQRFIEEAQIEGQLQHPGIVPVYGLGVQPDGRPYFAMKLVKGETLASILKARKKASENRGHLLAMFEQICQTVAYAHARRVIHRDLKPANVLIGSFGQMQVVDWGFAKVLPRGGVADEVKEARLDPDVSRIETIRSGPGSSGSMAGSVMGTPAYMPPEQALGQPERVDETSDVFSLGAILTEILTGRPPYTGKDSRAVLIKAAQAKTERAFERLDKCGADPELVDLAKRSLAPAQNVRPRDAGEVAESISDYRASVEERARKAELEAVAERTKAVEERRRRKLTLALAATVLIAVVGAGGTFWWMDVQARNRTQTANSAVATALQKVAVLQAEARAGGTKSVSKWEPAAREAEAATTLAESNGADEATLENAVALRNSIREDAKEARRAAERAKLLEAARHRIEEILARRNGAEFPHAKRSEDFTAAFRDLGIDIRSGHRGAVVTAIGQSPLRGLLVRAVDYWALLVPARKPPLSERLAAVLAGVDPDPWRETVRKHFRDDDREALVRIAEQPGLAERSPRDCLLLADCLLNWNEASVEKASLAAYRAACLAAPDDYWTNFGLGYRYLRERPPRPELAIPYLTHALAVRPESLAPRYRLVDALFQRGDLEGAITHARKIRERDPDFGLIRVREAGIHVNLAVQAMREKRTRLAIEKYRQAAELAPDQILIQNSLGQTLARNGRYREAREVFEKLVELDPGLGWYRVLLGVSEFRLGNFEGAVESLHAGLVRGLDSKQTVAACERLGAAAGNLGQWDRAFDAYEKGIAAAEDVNDGAEAQMRARKAEALLLRGRAEEAVEVVHAHTLAPGHHNVAKVILIRALRRAGRGPEALPLVEKWLGAAIATFRTRPSDDALLSVGAFLGTRAWLRGEPAEPDSLGLDLTDVQRAIIHTQLAALAKTHLANLDEQLRHARQAYDLAPTTPKAAWSWILALWESDRWKEVMRTFEEYSRHVPQDPNALRQIWTTQMEHGQIEEALPHLRAARDTCPKDCGLCREAVRTCEACLALLPRIDDLATGQATPETAESWYRAAETCEYLGRHADALALFERARREGPPPRLIWATEAWSQATYLEIETRAALNFVASSTGTTASRARSQALETLRRHAEHWKRVGSVPCIELKDLDGAAGKVAQLLCAPRYAPVREEEHLAKLPEAEAAEWRAFWKEVRELWQSLL